jgi:hypothetical protein
VRRRATGTRTEFPNGTSQENVADLLRGTSRLNAPIGWTVFEVSGQYRIAVMDFKPIDRALTVTGLMIKRHVNNGGRGAGPLLIIMRRASND